MLKRLGQKRIGWLLALATAFVTGFTETVALAAAQPADAALSAAQVNDEINKVLKSSALASAKVGVHVVSLTRPREVFAKNADLLLSPASNMKLVTTAAALHFLKPNYRFKTQILTDGTLNDGTLTGNLYVKGFGDPSLVSERVWFVVNELYHLGIRRITGDVIGDDTFFDDQRTQKGWDEDQSDRAYQAMTSALSLNFNTLTVRVLPGPAPGKPGVVLLDPPNDFADVVSEIQTGGKRAKIQIDIVPMKKEARDEVVVSGRIPTSETGRAFWRKVDYPTEFTTAAVLGFLKRAGVNVSGAAQRGVTPSNATVLLSVESPRLAEIVDDLNKSSNNFVAEQIVKTLGAEMFGAPGSWDKGLAALRQFMTVAGVADSAYTINNGSGLGDVNRLTARQFTQVLQTAWANPMISPEYVSSMGVAGSSGTLRHRMIDGPGTYRVRAKTGSLAGACTLSGFIHTSGGEQLAFSILVNAFQKMHAVHDAQDKIAEILVRLDENVQSAKR